MGAWLKKPSTSCLLPAFLPLISNSQNPKLYSISYRIFCREFRKYRILKILSNIIYPIEYSYGSTKVSTIYPTFSTCIAYSIYSTSHFILQVHDDTGIWYRACRAICPICFRLITFEKLRTAKKSTSVMIARAEGITYLILIFFPSLKSSSSEWSRKMHPEIWQNQPKIVSFFNKTFILSPSCVNIEKQKNRGWA